MDWKRQNNFVSSKLSRIIGIYKKISKYLNTDKLVLIFKSLFMAHLNYGSHIWGNTFDSDKKYIIQLQNRAIKYISYKNDTQSSSEFMFKQRIW